MGTERVEVKVGQIWKDNDRRWRTAGFGRLVLVMGLSDEVDQAYAICRRCDTEGIPLTRRETRIRLDRFRPNSTGYVIFKQPAGPQEVRGCAEKTQAGCPPEGTEGKPQ
jgi:hypothetical protein